MLREHLRRLEQPLERESMVENDERNMMPLEPEVEHDEDGKFRNLSLKKVV